MRGHRIGHATTIVVVCLVAAAAFASPAGARGPAAASVERTLPRLRDADDGLARALAEGRLSEAEYALERALSLVEPERARRLFGALAEPGRHDGTPILRDLAARLPGLAPARRKEAERILARPTDRRDAIHGYRTTATRHACDPRLCIWWVTKTSDAPSLVDRNRNGLPDWVDRTRTAFTRVWRTEIGRFGYARPRSDVGSRNHGVDGRLDVYIGDVGSIGLYGYCTTDDPLRAYRRSVSSYCVVDDDFSARQFSGAATGIAALRVTAAHEFFHAVQYAYDWLEDLWLMEGTAAWIEDEVFDGVNDNRQYLRTSPLSPRFFWYPLDYYNPDPAEVDAGLKYGAWIFWRYLSERYGRGIVRGVWRRADARRGAPNEYSAKAVSSVLRIRGLDLGDVFADFGVANFLPRASYSEGASYPAPLPTRTFAVTASGVGRTGAPMYHLANDYYAFRPSGLTVDATLSLAVEVPPARTGVRAGALVERSDGTVTRVGAEFDPVANAWRISVPGFGATMRVVLVLTNAGTRYRCRQRTVFSCQGVPLDDSRFSFQASVG
ncbi:MAG: hypothetical protein ICV74_02990 [Thermoleophilia bacterium]|nr:hypothetical protein [Thermoleophilia bacterium]